MYLIETSENYTENREKFMQTNVPHLTALQFFLGDCTYWYSINVICVTI